MVPRALESPEARVTFIWGSASRLLPQFFSEGQVAGAFLFLLPAGQAKCSSHEEGAPLQGDQQLLSGPLILFLFFS